MNVYITKIARIVILCVIYRAVLFIMLRYLEAIRYQV